MKFDTQDHITWRCEKNEFSELATPSVAMATTHRGKLFYFPLASAVFSRLAWNLAHRTDITWRCEKLNFRNCYPKRCHGNQTYREKFLFPLASAVVTRLAWNLAHRTDNNMALWKMEFSELLPQALPWQPHISGKIILFSFSLDCGFYPISDHLQIWHEGALW